MKTKVRTRKAARVAKTASQVRMHSALPAQRISKAMRDNRDSAAPAKVQPSRKRSQAKRPGSMSAAKSARPRTSRSKTEENIVPISTAESAKENLLVEATPTESARFLPVISGENLQTTTVEPEASLIEPERVACQESNPEPVELPGQSTPQVEATVEIGECAIMPSQAIERQALEPWWKGLLQFLELNWRWAQKHIKVRRIRKRLRVCETVSLGDKRFIAVIQVDGEEFLVGGASNSVSTLARLERPQEFSTVLRQRWTEEPAQA